MSQFLPRGCHISEENRIKKMVAHGCDWQIYLTNLDSYVLAVKMSLYEKWISEYPGKVLTIDADGLDFQNRPEDFATITDKIDSELYGLF